MKIRTKITLSIVLAALLLPVASHAQRSTYSGWQQGSTSTQSYIDAVTQNADLDTLFINTGSGSVGVSIKKR